MTLFTFAPNAKGKNAVFNLRISDFRGLGFASIFMCLLLWKTATLSGQNEAHHWYFGQYCGMEFTADGRRVITDSDMHVREGSASYADPQSGKLLFYTNGLIVWDALNDTMPGSSLGLPAEKHLWPGTNSTTQAALIVPHPGRPRQYYILNPGNQTSDASSDPFARQLYGELSYTLVDLSLRDGLGDVIERASLSPGISMSEKLSGTARCPAEGNEYWVVALKHLSNTFYAYHVGPDGVSTTPVISPVGVFAEINTSDRGQMKISPNGRMLALVRWASSINSIQLYRFDAATGKLSGRITIDLPGVGSYYGLCFSPDNSRLYVINGRSDVFQLSLGQFSKDAIESSAVMVAEREIGPYQQMQIGPDGRVYVATYGQTELYVIKHPNRAGLACAVERDTLTVGQMGSEAERAVIAGLPNFMDYIFNEEPDRCELPLPAFEVGKICQGICAEFSDRSLNEPGEWHWQFAGGFPSTWNGPAPPPICYEEAGRFEVTLEVRNDIGSAVTTQSITVLPAPLVDAGEDLHICRGSSAQLRAAGNGSVHWEPARGLSAVNILNPVASPRTTTAYIVTLRDEQGCENRDTVLVLVESLKLDVSGRQSICAGESVQLRAAGGLHYEWSPAEGLSDVAAAEPVAQPRRSTSYRVSAYDEFGCTSTATVVVDVLPPPVADAGADTTICAGTSLLLRGSGGERYLWHPAEGLNDPTRAEVLVQPLRSTRYTLTVFNGQDCSSSASVQVTVRERPELQLSGPVRICPGDSVQLHAAGGLRYEWEPSRGLSDPTSAAPKAAPERTTLYRVTAYNAQGCSSSGTIRVVVENTVGGVRSTPLSLCAGEAVELEAFGGERYSWHPPEGLSDATTARPTARPKRSQRYTVRIGRGDCESEHSVDIRLVPRPGLKVKSRVRICAGDSTVLKAEGGEVYEWSPSRGLSDPHSASPTARPRESTVYTVRSWNAAGCESTATLRIDLHPWQTIQLSVPQVEATPGEEVLLPLEIRVPDSHLPVHIEFIRLDLRYDVRLIELRGIDGADLLERRREGDDEVLGLELRDLTLRESGSTALALRVMGLIALSSQSDLAIENARLDLAPGSCLEAEWSDGSFAIHEFCLGYGISFAPRLQLQVQPNPVVSDIRIRVRTAAGLTHRLKLFDAFGRFVWERRLRPEAVASSLDVQIGAASLPAGSYVLRLENRWQAVHSRLLIVR